MATYTDLGNRVRENVVVDYHTRETAQCVKLLNDNNEYHGVFKGVSELSAVNVVGGELSGVTLRDVEFAGGIYLPGHTDITDLGQEIADVKHDMESRCNEIDTGLQRVGADLKSAKNSLDDKIHDAKRDCEDKIDANASDISRVEKACKADVVTLTNAIENLKADTVQIGNLQTVHKELSTGIENLRDDVEASANSLELSMSMVSADVKKTTKIADKTAGDLIETNSNVSKLSGDVKNLSDNVVGTQKNFQNLSKELTSEAETRRVDDNSLCTAINTTNTNLGISVNNLTGWLQRVADTAAGVNTWKQPLAEVSTALTHALEISASTLTAADAAVATRIEALEEDSKLHVSKESFAVSAAGLESQINSVSSTLNNALKDTSAFLTSSIDDAKEEAFNKTAAAVEASTKELFTVSTLVTADMQFLSDRATQLENGVMWLCADLAGEKSTRIDKDNTLLAKIDANAGKAAEDIAFLNETLSQSISEVEQTAAEELAKLAKKTEEDIWTGCHYKIVEDGMKQWPYKCEDFAVNCYPEAGPDAVVKYYDAVNNETHSIGSITPRSSGGYTFKIFDEVKPEIVAAAVEAGGTYIFPADGQSIATNLGCQLQYKPTEDGLDGEIAAAPIAPKYCSLQCGGIQIGKIYDAAFDGSDNLLSGKITIQTADREFASFLGFYAKPFDLSDCREIRVDTEKIEYLGNNEFELYSGIEERRRVDLSDAVSNRVFGYLLSSAAADPVEYDEDGKIQKIVANVDYADDRVVLKRTEGFRKTLSSWTDVDGRGWRRVLEADVEEGTPASCSFSVVEESMLKEMPIESIDAEKLLSGCLVPEVWNIENPLALDFGRVGKISAYVSAFVPVEAIQRECYVLEKKETGSECDCGCGSSVETVFAASESDGAGNSVELKFSGRAFHMVVTSADGKVLRYSYAFKSRDEWNDFASGSERIALAETNAGPLAFGGVVEAPAFSWKATADSRQLLDPREDFTMTVAKMDRRIELALPDGVNGRAREFIAMVKPAGNDALSVVFVDKHGQKLDDNTVVFSRKYGAETSDTFMAPAKQWTAFKIQEIQHGRFVVVDSLDIAGQLTERFSEIDASIAKLSSEISSEILRVESVEEKLAKTCGDLSEAISKENSRAEATEKVFSDNLEAETTRAKTEEEDLAQRATTLEATAEDHETRVKNIETEASKTFAKAEFVAGGKDVAVNLLKLVDVKDTSKTYTLLVDNGTLVLSVIEAAN